MLICKTSTTGFIYLYFYIQRDFCKKKSLLFFFLSSFLTSLFITANRSRQAENQGKEHLRCGNEAQAGYGEEQQQRAAEEHRHGEDAEGHPPAGPEETPGKPGQDAG